LVTGWVKILSVTREGQELVLALRGQGDIIGELAGEATGYRSATVRAIGTVHSLIVAHDIFTSFLNTHPGADRAYRHAITQRWSEAATELRIRSTTSGAQRLAGLLVALAVRHGTKTEDAVEIEMPLSQEELASLVGASRTTVTRAYSDWRRRGLIRTGHRHIAITNLDKLRMIALREGSTDQTRLRQPQPSSPPRMRSIRSRHRPPVTTRIGPDLSREFLISTDAPSKATSTQLPESALALLLRHAGAG
jgi:CRP-like cAMP-binding protein